MGTAGWSIPAAVRDRFPAGDSVLARYAQVFDLVEINSSFYRPHQRKTYERWAASTPERFRFAVKAPQTITHERRLADVAEPLARFLDEIAGLGGKLGPVLIQLPPSLRFDVALVADFLDLWRKAFTGETALEPRHVTWFSAEAEALLRAHGIARVAADPAITPEAAEPGGFDGFAYMRLHGSPTIYESAYVPEQLATWAAKLPQTAYVIFDNTKFGAATENALAFQRRPNSFSMSASFSST